MPVIGDQIEVAGTKVDQAPRNGLVIDVRGRMITVQWSTGDQSVFVPAAGTVTVVGRADTRHRRTSVSVRASRSAGGAGPVRKSTKKTPTKKAPVRKTTKKVVARTTARKAPARKTAKRRTTVTKKATRKRVR